MHKTSCHIIILTALTCLFFNQVSAQYMIKAELGYLSYLNQLVDVDPGEGWLGYNLNDEQNGVDLMLSNGFKIRHVWYAGVGAGYQNFEGIDGMTAFADVEYRPMLWDFSPLANLKIGYSHLWNQYENGTGTAMAEFTVGLNYIALPKVQICVKTGLMIAQQCAFFPIRLGFYF